MKITAEWQDLSEETKQEIIKDAEHEKQDSNNKLNEYIDKFKNDRSLRRKIVRAIGKISPNFELNLDGLTALASYFPFGYKVLSKEPFSIEMTIEDEWFEVIKDLPIGGLILSRKFSKKKVAKDLKGRCGYYGTLSKFETD